MPDASLPATYRHFPEDYQPQRESPMLSSSPYRHYPEDYQPQREGRPSSSSPPVLEHGQSSKIQSLTDMGSSRAAKRVKTVIHPGQQARMQRQGPMQLSDPLSPTQQTRMQRQQHPTMRFPESLRRFPEPMQHITQQRGPTSQLQDLGRAFTQPQEQQQASMPAPVVPQMHSAMGTNAAQASIAATRPTASKPRASTRAQVVEDYDPMWHTLSRPVAPNQSLVAFRSEAWTTPMALSPVFMVGLPLGGTVEVANVYPRSGSARRGGHTQSGNGQQGGMGRN